MKNVAVSALIVILSTACSVHQPSASEAKATDAASQEGIGDLDCVVNTNAASADPMQYIINLRQGSLGATMTTIAAQEYSVNYHSTLDGKPTRVPLGRSFNGMASVAQVASFEPTTVTINSQDGSFFLDLRATTDQSFLKAGWLYNGILKHAGKTHDGVLCRKPAAPKKQELCVTC